MCRVVESRGNGYSWGCVYGCGNVVDYWNITYVSWQFSKIPKILFTSTTLTPKACKPIIVYSSELSD